LRDEEENTATAFLPVFKSGDATLYVSIRAAQSISGADLLGKAIQTKIKEVFGTKKYLLRKAIIEQSVKSKDVNSFLFRLVRAMSTDFVYARDISLFFTTRRGKNYLLWRLLLSFMS
jgi:hypothetical protein